MTGSLCVCVCVCAVMKGCPTTDWRAEDVLHQNQDGNEASTGTTCSSWGPATNWPPSYIQTAALSAGQYTVVVEGWSSESGPFGLHWELVGAAPPAPSPSSAPAPAPSASASPAPPAGASCASPPKAPKAVLNLPDGSGVEYGDTSSASNFFSGYSSGEDLYTFEVPASGLGGKLSLNLCDPVTNFDTFMYGVCLFFWGGGVLFVCLLQCVCCPFLLCHSLPLAVHCCCLLTTAQCLKVVHQPRGWRWTPSPATKTAPPTSRAPPAGGAPAPRLPRPSLSLTPRWRPACTRSSLKGGHLAPDRTGCTGRLPARRHPWSRPRRLPRPFHPTTTVARAAHSPPTAPLPCQWCPLTCTAAAAKPRAPTSGCQTASVALCSLVKCFLCFTCRKLCRRWCSPLATKTRTLTRACG